MIREFTENAVSKAKEEVALPCGIVALIAVASFIVGLIVGILCASGSGARKAKIEQRGARTAYDPDCIDFGDDDDEDNEDFEYSF